MLKRKYANRPNWKRIIDQEYVYTFINNEQFQGYVTLLKLNKVSSPLVAQYNEETVCIVDNGFSWLQHFPSNEHYSVTTMFNAEGEIVQWYIDICHENGIENDVPWMDDLFLDVIVLPNGKVILKDIDELETALFVGVIDKTLYNLAYQERDKLLGLINQGKFHLMDLSLKHRDDLLTLIK